MNKIGFLINSITLIINLASLYVPIAADDGKEWVTFFDEWDNPHNVSLSMDDFISTLKKSESYSCCSDNKVKFWLYTRLNPMDYEELFIDIDETKQIELASYFSRDKPVLIITHGWISSGNTTFFQDAKDTYLEKVDGNVIIVDWSALSFNEYVIAATLTSFVGKQICDLLRTLRHLYWVDGDKMHMVGHSLGAHAVGLAARRLLDYNFPIARVTGLDPARPFFEFPYLLAGLDSDVATFVDVIHTNAGVLGVAGARGHADFYPDGGASQHHCRNFGKMACSHNSANVYFRESMTDASSKYQSYRCSDYTSYEEGKCKDNDIQYMGYLCKPSARGTYYLNVSPNYTQVRSEIIVTATPVTPVYLDAI